MEKVLKRLGVELPGYCEENDPTKQNVCEMDWTIHPNQIKEIDNQQKQQLKEAKKRKTREPSDEKKGKMNKQDILVNVKQE